VPNRKVFVKFFDLYNMLSASNLLLRHHFRMLLMVLVNLLLGAERVASNESVGG